MWRRAIWSGLPLFLVLALAFCAAQQVAVPERGPVVAVWDLEDVGPFAKASPGLGEILSNEIIETIRQKGNYTVVERDRLRLVLEELNLGTTSLVDEATRLRLGKLVGARLMVFGGYQTIGDMMRLDVRLVEVESGRMVRAVSKTAPAADLPQLLKTAREAAADLL
jgi:curli biogenesis system outer membrane secretion channel CsgG